MDPYSWKMNIFKVLLVIHLDYDYDASIQGWISLNLTTRIILSTHRNFTTTLNSNTS